MLDTELIKQLKASDKQVYILIDGIYYPIIEVREERGNKLIVCRNVVVRQPE